MQDNDVRQHLCELNRAVVKVPPSLFHGTAAEHLLPASPYHDGSLYPIGVVGNEGVDVDGGDEASGSIVNMVTRLRAVLHLVKSFDSRVIDAFAKAAMVYLLERASRRLAPVVA
jgi:hypothetical protein